MAANIHIGRYTSDYDGPLVIFLIGFRINRVWKISRWWPVFRAMGPMIEELSADPDSGFLGAQRGFFSPRAPFLIQYWRSFGDLERYARDPDQKHLPAWADFNRGIGDSEDVGIWHETYVVKDGAFETIYGNMPRTGLAAFTGHVPITESRDAARKRMHSHATGVAAEPQKENGTV